MYKSNKYLHFYGYAKKRDHYYNIHLCAYPITLYKKVTYISVHMGTKKTKKLTITIFIPCKFIECQSYHDVKGLVVCMFFLLCSYWPHRLQRDARLPSLLEGILTFLGLLVGRLVLGGNTTLLQIWSGIT